MNFDQWNKLVQTLRGYGIPDLHIIAMRAEINATFKQASLPEPLYFYPLPPQNPPPISV